MTRIRIRHETGFRYAGTVSSSYNEARMLPASQDGQFVLFSHLEVAPTAVTHGYVDYWGTRVTAFEILGPHEELSLTASSLVETAGRVEQAARGLSWSALEAAVERSVDLVDHGEHTRLARPHEELAQTAREVRSRAATPEAAARELLAFVHGSIDYVPGSTGVRTTAREAWSQRRGVCQDISHMVLGALREAGIPARYVSGYHHPRPDAPLHETVPGESHAWIEFWDGAWRGWDPTNDVPIDERHVFVGRGRDYNDVPPLRGVYAGPTESQLFVSVEITREA